MTARLSQIGWVAHYLDDLESDFSAIHRIDDMHAMDSARFFRLAWRISTYPGVMQMRVNAESERQQAAPSNRQVQRGVPARSRTSPQAMSVNELMVVAPGLIERAVAA